MLDHKSGVSITAIARLTNVNNQHNVNALPSRPTALTHQRNSQKCIAVSLFPSLAKRNRSPKSNTDAVVRRRASQRRSDLSSDRSDRGDEGLGTRRGVAANRVPTSRLAALRMRPTRTPFGRAMRWHSPQRRGPRAARSTLPQGQPSDPTCFGMSTSGNATRHATTCECGASGTSARPRDRRCTPRRRLFQRSSSRASLERR